MSDWDRRYHREELEKATGEKWFPSSSSISRCSHDLARARRILASLRSIDRLIRFTQMLSIVSLGGGVAVGTLGIYRTVGPTVAFIVPAIFIFLAGIGTRIPLTIYAIDKAELDVVDREEAYNAAVAKEIAS